MVRQLYLNFLLLNWYTIINYIHTWVPHLIFLNQHVFVTLVCLCTHTWKSTLLPFSPNATTNSSSSSKAASSRYFSSSASKSLNVNVLRLRVLSTRFAAGRRALRYDDDDGDEDDEGVEYGHNKEIAVLDLYNQCERRSTYCACSG